MPRLQNSLPRTKGKGAHDERHHDERDEVAHVACEATPGDAAAEDAAVVIEIQHAALAGAAVVAFLGREVAAGGAAAVLHQPASAAIGLARHWIAPHHTAHAVCPPLVVLEVTPVPNWLARLHPVFLVLVNHVLGQGEAALLCPLHDARIPAHKPPQAKQCDS